MKKSEMTKVICESIMTAGLQIDDRLHAAIKAGVHEIKRIEFREKQMTRRRKYQEGKK